MKIFTRPENLNGTELMNELAEKGIKVHTILDFANGTIGFETDNESAALSVVEAHNGNVIPKELSVNDKLASVGLNINDLKTALGL